MANYRHAETDYSGNGGARKGSGRKLLRGPTCVRRVPEKYEPAMKAFFDILEAAEKGGALDGEISVELENLKLLVKVDCELVADK